MYFCHCMAETNNDAPVSLRGAAAGDADVTHLWKTAKYPVSTTLAHRQVSDVLVKSASC